MDKTLKEIIKRLTEDNKKLLMEIDELQELIYELKRVLYGHTD